MSENQWHNPRLDATWLLRYILNPSRETRLLHGMSTPDDRRLRLLACAAVRLAAPRQMGTNTARVIQRVSDVAWGRKSLSTLMPLIERLTVSTPWTDLLLGCLHGDPVLAAIFTLQRCPLKLHSAGDIRLVDLVRDWFDPFADPSKCRAAAGAPHVADLALAARNHPLPADWFRSCCPRNASGADCDCCCDSEECHCRRWHKRRFRPLRLDPVRLKILADAVEDADGDPRQVSHLRMPGIHLPECWALDSLLPELPESTYTHTRQQDGYIS